VTFTDPTPGREADTPGTDTLGTDSVGRGSAGVADVGNGRDGTESVGSGSDPPVEPEPPGTVGTPLGTVAPGSDPLPAGWLPPAVPPPAAPPV
jgi:hypothetical protein